MKPLATVKKISKDPPDSKTYDDELDPLDCKANDEMTTAGESVAAIDKKLPPCPYGKKCYR